MARKVEEFKYGSFTFTVQKAGGVDGMDGFFLLAKGALPALEELISKGRELFERADVLQGAQMARSFMAGADVAGSFQAPAPGVARADATGDLSALLPLLRSASKMVGSITGEERTELRRLYLFNGGLEVMHPKDCGHAPEGTKPERLKRQLTREVWDELFEGDPWGAWYVFLWVLRFNLGNSSPALAALRSLFPTAKGGTSNSEKSDTSAAGSTA